MALIPSKSGRLPYGVPNYSPNDTLWYKGGSLPGGGPSFDPETLFSAGNGEWWEVGDLSTMFTDAAGTVPVASNGDPVGAWHGKRGLFNLIQSDTGSKPIYRSADKCIALFDDKNMNAASFTGKTGDVPWTWFVYSRMSTASENTNQVSRVILQPAVHTFGVYGTSPTTKAASVSSSYAFGASSSNAATRPALDEWMSIVSAMMSTSGGNNKFFYNDDPTDQRASGTCNPIVSENSSAVYMSAFPSSGEWQVRMILGIARELTPEEIASLFTYAGALP